MKTPSYLLKPKFIYCLIVSSIFLIPQNLAWSANKKKTKGKSEKTEETTVNTKEMISFKCASEIFYRWKKTKTPNAEHKTSGLNNRSEQSANLQAANNAENKGKEVFFIRIEANATTKEKALNKLSENYAQQKQKALNLCHKSHESKALCISTQLQSMAQEFRAMDFTSRKAFIDALRSDCDSSIGECLSAFSSEPQCQKEVSDSKAEINEPSDNKKINKKGKR